MTSITVPKADYSMEDIVFALAMLGCGFLYWNLINVATLGAGVTVFAAVFITICAIYLKRAGYRQTWKSIACLMLAALSASAFAIFDSMLVKALNFIFLSVVAVYWISMSTGRNLDARLSVYIVGDLFNQLLVVPFRNFACCFGGISQLLSRDQRGKGVLTGALGILMILPVLVLVASLLASADAAFDLVVKSIRSAISEDMIKYILQFLMGIPVACYLYGLVYGDRYDRNTNAVTIETVDRYSAACRLIPETAVYAGLTALNLLYAVFFLSQSAYLFSAFSQRLPELMTYSEYARRGFFELCAVAAIDLAVITAAHILSKREKERILRAETAVLCAATLLLIATAISKMIMYISSYGLTQLRVYTTWFMLLLFFAFAVIAARQFMAFNAARIGVIGFVVFFMILCYGNVDGQIAKYNIDRYKAGSLENLDVTALSYLSDAAVPPMYELYRDTADEALKGELADAMGYAAHTDPLDRTGRKTFRDFSLQSFQADRIREML